MNIAAVDPGLKGGIVIATITGHPIAAYKMPLKKKRDSHAREGGLKRLDLGAIQDIIITHEIELALVETSFKDGKCNACKTEAVLELCGVPIINIHPRTWQTILPKGRGKRRAYDYCLANGLPVPVNKNGKFHDGIADAWCIMAYYLEFVREV